MVDSNLVKEVIPGNNVENIGSFWDIWSTEPFVKTVTDDQKFTEDAHYERTVTSYRAVII